jgi:hypothetical protein
MARALRDRMGQRMRCVLVTLLLSVALTSTVTAREIVVTSTADRGTGTLRSALQTARSGDVITFDSDIFPPENPATISPRSELPPIDRSGITIDASDAGVIVDGSNVPGDWNNGLQIYADDCVVMGLQIVNFNGSGIAVCSANRNTIGGDRQLGTGPVGQGNLVCGNGIGIDVCDSGTSDNVIAGNLIGVRVDGSTPWGNRGAGVSIEPGATHNTLGPDNIVAYNGSDGVTVSGAAAYSNTITRNAIFGNGTGTMDGDIHLVDGGNTSLPAPEIVGIEAPNSVIGTAAPNATIEFFSGHRRAEAFEGATVADDEGRFSFRWTDPIFGPYLLCTATDPLGNTSPLSAPMATITAQSGKVGTRRALEFRSSIELADNRIGGMWNGLWQVDDPADWAEVFARQILGLGLKRARLTINSLEQVTGGRYVADMSRPETSIIPAHDALFTMVAEAGVEITYTLTFWDKESPHAEEVLGGPRFQTEDQIARYLEFVRFVVRHFRNRVVRFEIWNEPDLGEPGQHIDIDDYIELVRRAIPVIRSEWPEALVQVGGTAGLRGQESLNYLTQIVQSDIMPWVDVVSWHPLFGESPVNEAAYYYAYPSIVREVKNTAETHGFSGEYEADEITWWTIGEENDQPWRYSTVHAAKYYARGIVMNLGLDCAVVAGGIGERPDVFPAIRNLCTSMEGNESIDLPVEIDIDYEGPLAYCAFRYPNGDRMLAVWTDGIAQDEDPGVPATITFPGLVAGHVIGIDVLHGFEQELVFEIDSGNTTIRDLLVKDYPILVRLSGVTFGSDYDEIVGDGFHQLGEPGAGTGSDRDGDGVPDDEDYCPDWPGSPETSGC